MGTRFIPRPGTIPYHTGNTSVCSSIKSCLPFINLEFLQTLPGVLKLSQAIVGATCESVMLNYGLPYVQIIGSSFLSLMTTNIASVSIVTLLLLCYVFSNKTLRLVRSSLLEIVFNLIAAVSYGSSSCFMLLAVKVYLYPLYILTMGLVAYPAMCAAYSMGFFLALVHFVDAYYSYKAFKGIS